MADMCLRPTPEIEGLFDKIQKKYPEQCKKVGFDLNILCGWIETYNTDNGKNPDFVPDVDALVNNAEKHRNMDGKSFLYTPESITYTPPGQTKQTYTVIGSHIYNKNGKEVYPEDNKHRRKIFANLAIQQGRAVVVTYRDKKYVVNNRNQIISATTGDMMKWQDNDGNRREILRLAQIAFREKQKAETTTVTQNVASEAPKTINIYAGTGENADLSNFAERPFKTWYPYHNNKPNRVNLNQGERSFTKDVETDWAFTKGNPQQRKILTLSVSDIFGGSTTEQFKTVEGAFQAAKLAFVDLENQDSPYYYYKDSLSGSARPVLTEEGKQLIKRLQEATGAEAKSIGRQIKGLNNNLWDNNSSEIMKELLRLSFLQNPQALQRLLATGNATLTHTQDKGKWGTEFPRLLMEVRAELGGEQSTNTNNTINQEENRSTNEDEIFSTISITQNASGRLGTMDKKDEEAFKVAKATLRDPQSTAEQIQQAEKALKDIYDRKNNEIQTIFKTVTDKTGATFSLEESVGSWLGGEEYSFRIKVSAPNQKAYDKTMQMVSYVAEGARQDAYIENLGEVDDSEVTSESLLAKEHTPFIHISFTRDLSQQEIATVQNLFNSKNSDAVPLDATVTKNEIVFALPVWKLGDNPTQEAYKDLYNKWYNKLKETYNNGKERELKGLVGESFRRRYERSRFHQADNAYSEEKERGYSSDRNNNFPQGRISEQDGQAIKSYVEKVVGLEQPSPLFEQFKKDIELLAGYYEGGGRVLSDDLPNITQELDDKLNNHFMGGVELSIEDYRELWKLIEFYDDNGERRFRERKTSSSPSQATPTPNSLAAEAVGIGFSEADIAASKKRVEEANKPKPERPKSAAYESALKPNESRVAQFSRTFSPRQIKDRGAMIAEIFSDILDERVQNEIDTLESELASDTASEERKEQCRQKIRLLKDPIKGRQLFTEGGEGIKSIVNEIKERIKDWMEYADDSQKVLYQNTLDYFDDLFNAQASLDIEEREGIRIINMKSAEQTVDEDENDEQDDGDDDTGHTASGSDGWSFQIRYENPFNSLSKKVRGMLYDVMRPETDVDDLGFVRHYPMGQIYASMLSYLSAHMQNADDFVKTYKDWNSLLMDKRVMDKEYFRGSVGTFTEEEFKDLYPNGYPVFPVLEEMATMYPWVTQIIDRLTDDYLSPEVNINLRYPSTGGAMASQLYTNFRKAYIPYGKIQLGTNPKTGEPYFGVTPLNFEMEDKVQYDKLVANYNNRMVLTQHSVYDANGKVSKQNAEYNQKQIASVSEYVANGYYANYPELIAQWENNPEAAGSFSQEDVNKYNEFIDTIRDILQSYGIDATRDAVAAYITTENGKKLSEMLSKLSYINDLISKIDDKKINDVDYILDIKNPYGEPAWRHFFDGVGMITDTSYMQSFYDTASHKTKYSYSADNFLMKRFRGVCMGSLEQRRKYIDDNFGKYEWFRNQKAPQGEGWKNRWLEFWYNYNSDQNEIPYRNIDNVTDNNKEGDAVVRSYTEWEEDDIWQVQDRSYDPTKQGNATTFYLSPIFSDSPMSMTVLGPKMNMQELLFGYTDDNKVYHQGAFVQLVNQELWRIGYVQRRAEAIKNGIVKPIANFDTGNGLKICFMPELNDYQFEATEDYPAQTFIDRMVSLREAIQQGRATVRTLEQYQIQAIQDVMQRRMQQYFEENAEHYAKTPLTDEQYYNMTYANAAIIQMTTVDLAFYGKNGDLNQMMTDFQKRFKEVYAGGIQLNTNSKYGHKTENVILLADDVITSPSYKKIAAIIDGSKNLSEEDKTYIKGIFMDINVADAQAIRAMHSFRSVLDMMGNWTDAMEEALNHFKSGEWRREDFDIIYQTIKPFVYAVIDRNDGFGGYIPVPQQHKNSEICALMMYDLISNDLKNSPVYEALSEFMENMVDAQGNHLIHMAQFESAGKVGNQGVINISFNPNKVIEFLNNEIIAGGKTLEFTTHWDGNNYLPNDEAHAEQNYKAIKEQADKYLDDGEISQEDYDNLIQYLRPTKEEIIDMLSKAALITNPDGTKEINPEVVHTIPMDNYYQQQPTPEHHIDAKATFGSQARNIVPADLPDDFEITLTGRNGNRTIKGKDAVIDFIYELLNENLIEDYFGKGSKKGLKGIFESKESLRDAVEEIVRGNPKYGKDFSDAMQIDENGNFTLSPNSPTIFNLMQEIITSFFKNRITKQKINGAALIQAAGIGLDEDLRLRFDDNGKLLGAECYMPLTAKEFFEPLLKTKVINGETVRVLDPEVLEKAGLDKAIGYRIPTENKSSMMPLIIKGFTPLQNGSAIVLPAEITAMAGSDFDVDKMFLMLSAFRVETFDRAKAFTAYEHQQAQEVINAMGHANIEDLELDEIDDGKFNQWLEQPIEEGSSVKNKDLYKLKKPRIHVYKYDFSKTPKENGRMARNNMIIQMYFGILTSKSGSESLFNPQGFKDVEKAAKVIRILTDNNLKSKLEEQLEGTNVGILPPADQIVAEFLNVVQERFPERYEEVKSAVMKMTTEQIQNAYMSAITAGNKGSALEYLLNSDTKTLEKFINKYSEPESPIYPQTFAHSHARNMAGVNQIGIYAIQGSMAAKYQRASVILREEQRLEVNSRPITNVDVSDNGKRLKNVGQMIGASADNGKKPNLTDMGSTKKTAPIIGYMLRTGLSHLEAALIINQPMMQAAKWSSNSKIWNDILDKYNPLKVKAEDVTTEMLMRSLWNKSSELAFEITPEEKKAIAALCYRILKQHEAQEYMTQISRADSPNGAMQNSYAKARIQQYKVDLFQAKMGQKEFPFIRIREALSNTAVDPSAPEDVVREQLKNQPMGFLHGMYALGINSFQTMMSDYFFGAQKWFDDRITKPILYNLSENVSDTKKEEIINNLYTSYITYMLSNSPLFNEEDVNGEVSTMKQKRDYYLKTFPDDYIKYLQENEDIRDLLSNVISVDNYGTRKRVVFQNVGSLDKSQKQEMQNRLERLLYSDNSKAKELARHLLIYSFFDNGFQFTHDSFSHLFTTIFLSNFPMYNETLLSLDEELPEGEENNFINQFLLTYPNIAYSIDSIVKDENFLNGDKNTIVFDFNAQNGVGNRYKKYLINEVMSPNPQAEGINVYPYVKYAGEVYVLDKDLFDENPANPTYRKLPVYDTSRYLPLFNRRMNVTQLSQIFPTEGQQQQQTSAKEDSAPAAPNTSDTEPSVNNSMQQAFDSMDDFEVPDYVPDAPVSDSERYQREGEGELQTPFCG